MVETKNINKQGDAKYDEIDIIELFGYLLRHWYVLILALVVGGIIGYVFVSSQPYTYTSEASIIIETETANATSMTDVQLGNALTSDFVELAGSRSVNDAAREIIEKNAGVELTRDALKSSVSVYNKKDTRILVFEATTKDAQLSCVIADAMAKATAEEVSTIMKVEEPTVVDAAEVRGPNNKGAGKKSFIGALILFAVVCAIYIIRFIVNDKIATEEDVKKYLGENVLGVISKDRAASFHKGKR